MIIDASKLAGTCTCGRTHDMATRLLIIEQGCLARFESLTADLPVNRIAVYDRNTYEAVDGLRPRADREIILDLAGLHANEIAVAKVLAEIGDKKPELLLAVGSGTVHDVTRYCAAQIGVPFVSVPTAASVDGFCSTVAAMTWHGYKTTMSAVAPLMVVADLDVISRAPLRLALSGAGDILGKFIAIADWQIASLLTGEYYCERIANMSIDAAKAVFDTCALLRTGNSEAYEKLTYALMLSGLAMQLTGYSRPASGSEHHISHLLELELPQFGPCNTLHGERVGVGALLASEEYHRIASLRPATHADTPMSAEALRNAFGALTDAMLEENKKDCLAAVDPGSIDGKMDAICEIIRGIPSPDEIRSLYAEAGLLSSLGDLGVDERLKDDLLLLSPCIRNRLTLMRIRRMLSL